LDTSDYAAMHTAALGSDIARIRESLKEMAADGHVEIGLSYHIVFEFLQPTAPRYRAERLARARPLQELCGENAFPYGRDLGKGYGFSKDGVWVPRLALEEFEIERLVENLRKRVAHSPHLTREQGRRLSKRKNFVAYVRSEPTLLRLMPGEPWHL